MPADTLVRPSGQFHRFNGANGKATERTQLGGQSLRGHELHGGRAAGSRMWLWVAMAIGAAAVAAFYLRESQLRMAEHAGGQAVEEARLVAVERPTASSTASVELPATIRPWQTAALSARVSGYLAVWHDDLGARVKAGELLAQIDTPELDQELAEAQASAREAAAAAVQADAERVEAEADLRVAEAQLERVKAEVELAVSQAARREKLVEKRAVSREENESFQKNLAVRNADVVAAEADVARRHANLKTRAAVIQARQAAVNSRESNVDRLKQLQGFKRIVAPFDGVVTRRVAEVGMLVTAGGDPLFVVEDMSRVRVQSNVPQTYAAQTVVGAEAGVRVPESSGPAVAGTITRVADSVDAASRTMLAEIELDNSDHRFQPGSYAQVSLQTTHAAGWTIPANTLHMRVEGPSVAVVNDRNEIEIRHVVLGRDLGTRVVAIDGIQGDERLVVNPGDELAHGARVRVNEARPVSEAVAQR